MSHCHHRDGLRPGSIADADDQAQFGELEVQGELAKPTTATAVKDRITMITGIPRRFC